MFLLRKAWKFVFVGVFILTVANPQTNPVGLKLSSPNPIPILVEELGERSPLSKQELEATTRLRLRRNGINILPSSSTTHKCRCLLYVNLNVIELDNASGTPLDKFAYNLEIMFTRGDLVAKGVGAMYGTVWTDGVVGYAPSSAAFRKTIPEALESLLDVFSIGFIEANDL